MVKLELTKGVLLVSLTIFVVVVAILFGESQFNNSLSIQSETQALELVNTELRKRDASSYLITSQCVSIITSEDEIYFNIEYHEEHNESCPGDPSTFPLLSMYRVNKETTQVEKYDIVEDKYQILETIPN